MNNASRSRLALPLILALFSVSLVSCFGGGNPLIGKWSLSPAAGGDSCPDTLEFTATSMTTTTAGQTLPLDVTYKADGSNMDVTSSTGGAMTFSASGNTLNMVAPQACQYVKS